MVRMKKVKLRLEDKKQMYHHELRFDGNYRMALERDRLECVMCGLKDYVVVHHIDFNPKNNDMDNLKTVCKTCHAKAHGINLSFNKPKVELIMELRGQGKTFQEVGDYLGISRQRVHAILRYQYERDLEKGIDKI